MDLSIIIPVYNVAPYLRACLDSVCVAVATVQKGLSGFTAEVICVDDGSTDGSGKILDEYAERFRVVSSVGKGFGVRSRELEGEARVVNSSSDRQTSNVKHQTPNTSTNSIVQPTFRVIHQKNAGVSAARNAALDVATGKWVFFLDGDDLMPAHALAEVNERLGRLSEIDSIGICMYKDRLRDEILASRNALPDIQVTGDQILGSNDAIIASYRWLALDKFYRREIVEKLHLRFKVGLRVGEDVQFAQLFLAQCGNVLLCPSLMGYEYRTRGESVMERMYDSLVHDPLDRFVQLHRIWKQTRHPGLLRLLVKLASETVSYGKEKIYGKNVRSIAIRLLVESVVFGGDMMNFLIMHGTAKGRIFAILYKMLPRFGRRKLLEVL